MPDVIPYRCPVCKVKRTALAEFAGKKAKCLQCGSSFRIPTAAVAAAEDDIDALAAQQESRVTKLPADPPSERFPGDGIDTDMDYPSLPAEPPAKKSRPKWLVPAAGGAVVLAAVAAAFFLLAGDPPPPPKKAPPPPAADDDDKPAPPPEAAATTPPPVVAAPVVVPIAPEPPVVMTADHLFAEYTAAKDDANGKYAGRILEVSGVCLSSRDGRVAFVNNNDAGEDVVTGVTAFVPGLAKRPDGFAEVVAAVAAPAAVAARPPADPDPALAPKPNRPVTVRGKYRIDADLGQCELVSTQAPADPKYLGRRLVVEGAIDATVEVPDNPTGPVAVYLEPPTTVCRTQLACYFRPTAAAQLRSLRRGQVVTVQGDCTGRDRRTVRLDDCTLTAAPPGVVPVAAGRLMADYEADILADPPVDLAQKPLPVSVAALAAAFQADPAGARKQYGRRVLEVSGVVVARTVGSRTVGFETPTTTDVRVSAAFGTAQFAKVPADATTLTVRGVYFGGPARQVRLDLAEVVAGPEPDAADVVTEDFLPAVPSSEWQVVRVNYPELFAQPVAARPGKAAPKTPKVTAAQAVRLVYRVTEAGRVRSYPVQAGEFAGKSILAPDAPPVKWVGPPAAPGVRFDEFAYRVTPTAVEIGTAGPPPAAGGAAPVAWQPVLRLGLKPGQTWTYESAAGVQTTAKVAALFADPAGRPACRVESESTDPKVKGVRNETTVVYVKGVGEVSRTSSMHYANGGSRLVYEQKIDTLEKAGAAGKPAAK